MRLRPFHATLFALAALVSLAVYWVSLRRTISVTEAAAPRPPEVVWSPTFSEPEVFSVPSPSAVSSEARAAVEEILRERLNHRLVRSGEAVLTFANLDAYRGFLERAMHTGTFVSGRIDGLLAVRVRVEDYTAFVRELTENTSGYVSISANAIVATPPPPTEERVLRVAAPVRGDLLAVLGVAAGTDTSAWGRGVTIAVLDGGASPDLTLGARLRYLDIGYGLTGAEADARHGTAVASIAAGAAADARGVAPAADLLSIRVLGTDGRSDAFAVAQGIVAAVDAGARVVNVSLGGYATSAILGEAVDYALAAGVAVVAAAGNDQTKRLMWPAAYPGVVSVGAVDAAGVQALFSNSGNGLQLTAPGYAIQAAAPGPERILFSGTSASAPVVAGAIAALLSVSEGIDAIQAADLLAAYSNDSGEVGADSDYGRGTLNLGWALDRANTGRIDPAVASQSHDMAQGTITVVVQNRGGAALEGLRLVVVMGGVRSEHALPRLAVAATTSVTVPLDRVRLTAEGRLEVWSQLVLPPRLVDREARNNRLGGVFMAPP